MLQDIGYETVEKPKFLTANTFFWRPSNHANKRRDNEDRNHDAAAEWLLSLGFSVTRNGDYTYAQRGDVKVEIMYRESCQHVYRRVIVTRSGKNSDLSIVR